VKGFLSRIFGGGEKPQTPEQAANGQDVTATQDPTKPKKKGFFGKIAGIFKDKNSAAVSKPQGQAGQP
jgi:hypothetical protein